MRPETLEQLLKKISEVKIAVIGDFCLDAYWFVDKALSEISIETGRPTEPVKYQKYSPGGAGNVTNNLAALGIKDIRAFGVIGPDPFGSEMIRTLEQTGVNTRNMLVQKNNWSTHVYIKPHVGDEEQNRIDFGNYNSLDNTTADRLIDNLKKEAGEVDLVIINQQVLSGIHTPYLRKALTGVISLFPGKIFIADSRNYSDEYRGAYRKMNDIEALRLCRITKEPGEEASCGEVTKAAERLFQRYGKPVFITRGSRGSLISDDKGILEVNGLMILSRTDTVGAGDSYLAGIAAAIAAGYSLETAAELGTFVAGVTIQKLFTTGTASPEEILKIGTDPDYVYNPDLADDIRQASYFSNSEIEIISKLTVPPRIRYAIFDNDGTISTLREGWEQIMAPVMIKAVMGDRYDDADRSLYMRVKAAVLDLIDKTTGIQTLRQMKLLIDLVRDFDLVPEDQILDEHGYKELYNDELMKMVRQRESKLNNKELSVNDLTIKGSVGFLKLLYDKNIKLCLTSGTDEEDVKHEASILGYDHFFEGRIYGATGDIRKEAKKDVLDRLLNQIGDSEAPSIVTFGDGPVEIRETHKHGGITVGVATNELRRFGLSESKRTRLIKAGAGFIIPDFSSPAGILELLNIR
ncbi:MAG TPA: PfkB family carbohydrate kinase [Bacteroidales bacterium]|jgi:rfaE bifunctional protein kinase chain/domain|nr:PfkB family carbohydrate kinase [Bacteroidales bacterium]